MPACLGCNVCVVACHVESSPKWRGAAVGVCGLSELTKPRIMHRVLFHLQPAHGPQSCTPGHAAGTSRHHSPGDLYHCAAYRKGLDGGAKLLQVPCHLLGPGSTEACLLQHCQHLTGDDGSSLLLLTGGRGLRGGAPGCRAPASVRFVVSFARHVFGVQALTRRFASATGLGHRTCARCLSAPRHRMADTNVSGMLASTSSQPACAWAPLATACGRVPQQCFHAWQVGKSHAESHCASAHTTWIHIKLPVFDVTENSP
jgi:hypothetical protein